MLDVRRWVYARLIADDGIRQLLGDPPRVVGTLGGEESAVPAAKPFAVIRQGPTMRYMPEGGVTTDVTIWVHDDPDGYTRIDQVIGVIRELLEGQIGDPDGIAVSWSGDSQDLADDARKTNVRTTSYRLASRR